MNDHTTREGHRPWRARILLTCISLGATACVIEKIDAIIAEHGVTWESTTGNETTGALDTSTSTSTSTGAEGTGQSHGAEDTSSASSTSGSSSISSGAEGPVCGDGIIEGDETCDDGNDTPDDGCQQCAKDSVVFISSGVFQGFALQGLYGADQRCRSLAAKAGILRPETFRAWLSTPTSPAAERLLNSRGRYILVNGLVVAQDWDALSSGTLKNPIMVDEHSQTQEIRVWTGTLPNGQPALGSEFCNDWDDDSGLLLFGGEGMSAYTDTWWSFFGQGACDHENRLYCVEQ